ncbi:MAG: hypothetical protein M1820_001744 [Bogoriella megaspora]|nr:MAG: hypothetical protein M1820_001744 [Bogoriella megaspora]
MSYLYRTPLDQHRREIRLLEIIKPFANDLNGREVHCKMFTIIFITENLLAALWHVKIRTAHEGCIIWADAISINQCDDVEKAQQVQLMYDIYEMQSLALPFLVFQVTNSGLAIETIEAWGEAGCNIRTNEEILEIARSQPKLFDPRAWEAVLQLFERPWWRRLWAIQEVVALKYCSLLCGLDVLHWYSLYYAKRLWILIDEFDLEFGREQIRALSQAMNPAILWMIKKTDYQFRILYEQTKFGLLEVLDDCRGFRVTDARDRIYGLLGMARMQGKIPVDYSTSVSQVYYDLARSVTNYTNRLDVIRYSGDFLHGRYVPQHSPDLDIPSWVPNWEKGFREDPFFNCLPAHIYSASGSVDAAVSFSNGCVLHTCGVLCDTIQGISYRMYEADRLS